MEQTLGNEKNEILSKLYALRAGLSVISQQNDEVKKIDEATDNLLIENYEETNNKVNTNITYWYDEEQHMHHFESSDYPYLQKLKDKRNYDEKWEQYHNLNEQERKNFYNDERIIFSQWLRTEESVKHFKTIIKELEDKNAVIEEKNRRAKKKFRTKLGITLGALATVWLAVIICAVIGFTSDTLLGFLSVGPGGFVAFILSIILILVVGCGKADPKELCDTQKYYDILQRMPVFTQRVQKAEEQKKPIPAIKKGCEEIYLALQREFTPILDVRDWKHTDLVIYYLETRRADSIKEALQLVDREMQTERIVQTVVLATQQICNTLAVGFTALNNSMVKCFNELSAQISAASAAQSARLARLTDSVAMGNALKAKANVASEKLMQDIHEIRNLICE